MRLFVLFALASSVLFPLCLTAQTNQPLIFKSHSSRRSGSEFLRQADERKNLVIEDSLKKVNARVEALLKALAEKEKSIRDSILILKHEEKKQTELKTKSDSILAQKQEIERLQKVATQNTKLISELHKKDSLNIVKQKTDSLAALTKNSELTECEKLKNDSTNAWRKHHVLGCPDNVEKALNNWLSEFNLKINPSIKNYLTTLGKIHLVVPIFTREWANNQLSKVNAEIMRVKSLPETPDSNYSKKLLATKLLERGLEDLRQIRMYAILKTEKSTNVWIPGYYQSSAKIFYDPNLQDEARISFFNQFSILTQFQTATIATEVARSNAGPVLLRLSALYSPEAAGADSASKLRAEELRFITAGGNVILDASVPLFYAQVNKFYFQTSFGLRASANAQNFKSTTNNFAALISPAFGINADFSTDDRVFQFTLASRIGYFGGTGAYYEAIFANNAAPKREFFFGQLNVGIKIKEKYSVYVQLPMFASEAMQNALMKIPASVALSFEFPEPAKK